MIDDGILDILHNLIEKHHSPNVKAAALETLGVATSLPEVFSSVNMDQVMTTLVKMAIEGEKLPSQMTKEEMQA